MSLDIRAYCADDAARWDEFCKHALQSTLLHTRLFLSYHGARFTDRSLIVSDGNEWLGVFPAALSQTEAAHVSSHPGITYGGIVHQGRLRGEEMIRALEGISSYYKAQGCERLTYKAVPIFYHRVPSQDDLYALFRLKASRVRCDLSSTIDLKCRRPLSERRRRSLKKAKKGGVVVAEGANYLAELWEALRVNLASKHGVAPVHSLEEIELLACRFPTNIRCVCGLLDGRVVAGVVSFTTATTCHAQYIAANDDGYEVSALDLVFEYLIEGADREGKRWFDFGISTEKQGQTLNNGLYQFKSEFGGGGFAHEFYELNLLEVT